MKITPYLSFNGQCQAALRFYERCLGGKIVYMMTIRSRPLLPRSHLSGPSGSIMRRSPWAIKRSELPMLAPAVIEAPRAFHSPSILMHPQTPIAFSQCFQKEARYRCRFKRLIGHAGSGCSRTNSVRHG